MADAENLKVTVTLDDESKELLRAIRDAVAVKAVEDAGRVRRLVESESCSGENHGDELCPNPHTYSGKLTLD